MLSELVIDNVEEWDDLVKSFQDYDIYYLSSYVKAFWQNGDGEPKLLYYEKDSMRAINVVMLRDIESDKYFVNKIEKDTYFDLATPYGYGGFIFEGEVTKSGLVDFDHIYSNYCVERGIVSEFVRFHPLQKNSTLLSTCYDTIELGKTVSMELNSIEGIWSNLTSKNRNMVRKARKSGVDIYWGRSKQLFDSFFPLYNATMDKDNAKKYYYFEEDFYKSILFDCKYNASIFYALYQGKIIAMSILLFANQKMHYHLSASDKTFKHLAPTNLLLYEAACWGYENGYRTFHLGGGLGSKEDSLYHFKSSFNRNSNHIFCIGKKIFDRKKYDELVKIREEEYSKTQSKEDTTKVITTDFFPRYRGE